MTERWVSTKLLLSQDLLPFPAVALVVPQYLYGRGVYKEMEGDSCFTEGTSSLRTSVFQCSAVDLGKE